MNNPTICATTAASGAGDSITGGQVTRQALVMLGYESAGQDTTLAGAHTRRALPIINQLLADILRITGQPFEGVVDAEQPLPLSREVAMRVLVPGLCAYLAQGENDSEQQRLYAALYQQARATLPAPTARVMDVLPRVW